MAFASVSFKLAAGRIVSVARDAGGRISSSSVEAVSAVEVEPSEKTRYLTSPPTERLTVVCRRSVIDFKGGNPGTSWVCASTRASRIEGITAANSAPSRSAPEEAAGGPAVAQPSNEISIQAEQTRIAK